MALGQARDSGVAVERDLIPDGRIGAVVALLRREMADFLELDFVSEQWIERLGGLIVKEFDRVEWR